MRGYKPVYLESESSKIDALSKFHPIDCIKANICDAKPCHPDATCLESSSEDGFTCLCNEGLTGDGIESCSVIPSASPSAMDPMTKPTAYPIRKDTLRKDFCIQSSDCEISNTDCVLGKCTCKEGFARRKSECININECGLGYINSCHRNANCIDTIGSYKCQCKDGFHDKDTLSLPGIDCIQTNECIVKGSTLCKLETEVCIDRRPPLKWECVGKTPAPTKRPTRRYDPPVPRCGRERKLQDSSDANTHVERYLDTGAPVTPAPATDSPVTQAPASDYPVSDTTNNAPTC
jgi:Calcium-binding EGF domain